ncbi:MAG: hypothetical protein HZB16_19475 [Armatimonadetes bacterium]|nr:hypothetical protein [Armatimonadota bacterium]
MSQKGTKARPQDVADDLFTASRIAVEAEEAAKVGGNAMERLNESVAQLRVSAREVERLLARIETLSRQIHDRAIATAVDAMRAVEAPATAKGTATGRVKKAVGSRSQRVAAMLKRSMELSELASEIASTGVQQSACVDEVSGAIAQLVEVVATLNSVDQNEAMVALLRGSLLDEAALDDLLFEV